MHVYFSILLYLQCTCYIITKKGKAEETAPSSYVL